jgi:uncharacterized membrane protein
LELTRVDIKTLFGLPAHPLIVHVPVVLLPLAAVGAVLAVAFARLRRPFGWTVVALTGVSTVFAKLAEGSGQALLRSVRESAALTHHTELGDSMWLFAGFAFAGALAFMLWDRYVGGQPKAVGAAVRTSPRRWVAIVLAVVMVLSGAVATARVIQVGHSGAKATWEDKTKAVTDGGDRGGG